MSDPMLRRMTLERRIEKHIHAQRDRNQATLKIVRQKLSGLNGPVRAHPTPDHWPPDELDAATPKSVDFFTACWIMAITILAPAAFDRNPFK
ncbi:MAG: hypothetical protein AAGF33_02845 [Pseudomonadota bacterium]